MSSRKSAKASTTVKDATLGLLRAFGIKRVFGNPGSTELPFLSDWPDPCGGASPIGQDIRRGNCADQECADRGRTTRHPNRAGAQRGIIRAER